MSYSSDSSSYSDDDDDDLDDMMMIAFLIKNNRNFIDRTPCRTSMLSGKEYIREIMCGNPNQCYEAIRMKPHYVLRALKAFALTVVKTTNRGEVQPKIRADSRWYPFFKNYIGAIDGTHVAAWAPLSKQKSFRGRKAVLVTQNVIATCSHDMMFTFVYTGWEGTANDSRFLNTRLKYIFALCGVDYFYVVDSGYPNLKGFLAPYRGERYHRSDWQGGSGVRGKKELFNFVHSSVRNVIERAFGVLKKRFHILKYIPNYPLRRQMLIPHTCCALHTYIRMEDRADTLFNTYGGENFQELTEGFNVVQEGFPLDMTDQDEMLQVRDSIANMLWERHTQRRQY
ncbi:hypothetical protein Lser_V15G37054 [Lactuca serriola]